MQFDVDVVLRGETHATTRLITSVSSSPRVWTDDDVQAVLRAMLLALDDQQQAGGDPNRPVTLRGVSWIVDPDRDNGGVLIALEVSTGAVVAGPFDIEQQTLENKIGRAMAAASPSRSGSYRSTGTGTSPELPTPT